MRDTFGPVLKQSLSDKLAQRIRAMQRESGARPSLFAAFSAHHDEPTRRRCLEAGFDLYLAKPASREEVLSVLRGQDPALAAGARGVGDSQPGTLGPGWVEPGLMRLRRESLASRRRLVDELAHGVAHGEREAVRVTAHKLAGSLAMYGFKEASRASRALEEAAGREDLAQLRQRCDALAEMIAQAQPVARPA